MFKILGPSDLDRDTRLPELSGIRKCEYPDKNPSIKLGNGQEKHNRISYFRRKIWVPSPNKSGYSMIIQALVLSGTWSLVNPDRVLGQKFLEFYIRVPEFWAPKKLESPNLNNPCNNRSTSASWWFFSRFRNFFHVKSSISLRALFTKLPASLVNCNLSF